MNICLIAAYPIKILKILTRIYSNDMSSDNNIYVFCMPKDKAVLPLPPHPRHVGFLLITQKR